MTGILAFPFLLCCFGFLELTSALLEPMPFPPSLQECYEYRSYNMTPSFETAFQIQNYCLRKFEYEQIAHRNMWGGPNITEEGINYINSLFRQILQEAKEVEMQNQKRGRKKRQINRRYRREVRSPGAFEPFANCIQGLTNSFVEDPRFGRNTYQTIAVFHSGPALRTAHNGPGFGPWHRIYLLLLETACGGVSIPYWESGLDHDMEDPTESILWSDQFFGNGDMQVVTGPFRDMRTILGGPIIRNIGTGNSALFTKTGVEAVLSRRFYEEITEPKQGQAYFYTLEGHHNGPHSWAGGHLSGPSTAAWDPVFFMHHAYVDAVWAAFREQQISLGINPETDYPVNTPQGHGIDDIIDFRPYFQTITNRIGMSNAIANLVTYEPFATCQNGCNQSPHLYCDSTSNVCVSRRRPQGAFGGTARFAFGSQDSQPQPLSGQVGEIPAGGTFKTSPLRDTRNRGMRLRIGPLAPEIQAASFQVREVNVRQRRDVSQQNVNVTSHHHSSQSVSSIARSFTNTFLMDGVADQKHWVYVPVRIVYTRSPNVQGVDPTLLGKTELSNDVCPTVQSGASKVFVSTDGLTYYGNYKEFAIIDERQPVSVTTTAVGIKNPEYGEGEVLFTAYDSCGRPCRPLCLTSVNGQQKYKPCSGTFKISTAAPTMYRNSYKEAISFSLASYNLVDSALEETSPSVAFVCGKDSIWPWVY